MTVRHRQRSTAPTLGVILRGVAYYLFNSVPGDVANVPAVRRLVAECLAAEMWGIGDDEPHRDALAAGDVALIYLGAPERLLMGRAELASPVRAWTTSEARACPSGSHSGVLLASVEHWDPPVPMETVLQQIDPSEGARADFQVGVVRISLNEYETVRAVAAAQARERGSPHGEVVR